jgi:hypothetical protein
MVGLSTVYLSSHDDWVLELNARTHFVIHQSNRIHKERRSTAFLLCKGKRTSKVFLLCISFLEKYHHHSVGKHEFGTLSTMSEDRKA